jgi:hypothetical protein
LAFCPGEGWGLPREAGLTGLTAAGLVTSDGPAALTDAGQVTYHRIRSPLEEITARLFDLPAEDLATAGRVLSIVTARAPTPCLPGRPPLRERPDGRDAEGPPDGVGDVLYGCWPRVLRPPRCAGLMSGRVGRVKLPVIFRSSSWLAVCDDGRFRA